MQSPQLNNLYAVICIFINQITKNKKKDMEVININYDDLKKNFMKIFPNFKDDIRIFKTSHPLCVLGSGICEDFCVCTPLSLNTLAVVGISGKKQFVLTHSDEITEYSRATDKLLTPSSASAADNIFQVLALCRQNICGADIVFSQNLDSRDFFHPLSAVLTAFSHINGISEQALANNLEPYRELFTSVSFMPECELFGRKNALLVKNKSKLSYFPIDLSKYRLILISGEIDCRAELKKIQNLYRELHKDSPSADFNINAHTPSSFEGKAAHYIRNELMRIKQFSKISDSTGMHLIFTDILKKSRIDLYNAFNTSGKSLTKMHFLAEASALCSFTLAAPYFNGICGVVENDKTDNFITLYDSLYKKEFSSRPSFYICDTDDSGIELLK